MQDQPHTMHLPFKASGFRGDFALLLIDGAYYGCVSRWTIITRLSYSTYAVCTGLDHLQNSTTLQHDLHQHATVIMSNFFFLSNRICHVVYATGVAQTSFFSRTFSCQDHCQRDASYQNIGTSFTEV